MEKIKSNFFESIGNKVSSYFSSKKKNFHLENEVSNDFNKYLEVEDVLFCMEMMETGFMPMVNQYNLLSQVMETKIFSQEINYEQLLAYPNTLKKFSKFHFPFIFDYARKNKVLENNFENMIDKVTVEKIVEKFMDFQIKFRAYYKNGLNIMHVFENYKKIDLEQRFEIFNTYKDLFKQLYDAKVMDGESFISFSRHLETTIVEIKAFTSKNNYSNPSFENIKLDYLEATRLEMRDYVVKNANQNDKSEVLKKIKKISSTVLDDTIKSIAIHRNYSVSQLQDDNKAQIKHIESLCDKIGTQEVNEWVNARLPVILEKYLSIDKEYRSNLKNVEGYNAQELMSQSLDNIASLLEAKLENKNADLITELSIENRKLKVR